jgi:tellurite resistance protein
MAFKFPKPTPKGLWRRTPPAIFPPILGLLGLGLAWRWGAAGFGLPGELAEALLGGLSLLAAFAVLTFVVKLARRPAVVVEDLRILPGYAGVAAAVLCLEQLVSVIAPYAPEPAWLLFWAALGLHLLLLALLVRVLVGAPAVQRRVNPAWHLPWSGLCVAGLAAQHLGMSALATALFWAALVLSLLIWAASAEQARRERVPAPLRPLLAIHLAPMAYVGALAWELQMQGIATALAALSAACALGLIVGARWLLAAGFSPLWSALTFPAASSAGLWLMLGGRWQMAGGLMLVLATMITAPVAFAILRDWAAGRLAIKTNAAVA